MEGNKVSLLDMVLLGAGFEVLSVLSWIVEASVGLDAEPQRLIHGSNKYTFESMVVLELPKDVFTVIIYAFKNFCVPTRPRLS